MSFPRFIPLATPAFGGVLLLLSACSSPVPPSQSPDGIWTGALVTEQGNCPTQTPSTLQIDDRAVSFTPGDNSLVLKGERGPDKHHYHAQLTMKDAQRKPYTLVFNGYPVGNAIGGTFGAPDCRAHVVLTRPTR